MAYDRMTRLKKEITGDASTGHSEGQSNADCKKKDGIERITIIYAGKEYGGGGTYTANLIKALQTRNKHLNIHSFFPQFADAPREGPGHFHCSIYEDNILGWMRMTIALCREFRNHRVDACLAMDHRSLRLAPPFEVLFRSVPWVYFLQSSLRMKAGPLRAVFRRFIFLFVKGICCVSHHVHQTLREIGYGRNACVVYSAAPTDFGGFAVETSKSRSRNVVLLAGRMVGGKGHEDLLQAATGRRWTIWFAGEGLLRESLQEACKTKQIDVQFLGWVDDMPSIFNRSTVVVFPSFCEALGLVVMEAMAHGKPVVAYDIEPQRELIRNGVTGVLVPLGDKEALGQAIQGLLDDPERATQMGLRAQKDVTERFTLERMANDTLTFLERTRVS